MKKIHLFFLMAFFKGIAIGQTHEFGWATTIGADDGLVSYGCTLTPEGDIVTIGNFKGTLDIDPGPAVELLDAESGNVYIQKLDADGNFIWAKTLRGTYVYDPTGLDITSDSNGNLYITGTYRIEADVDPGPDEYLLIGSTAAHVFILKLDADGNFEWAHDIGEGSDSELPQVATTADGDVYFCGNYRETIDFDFGPDEFFMTPINYSDVYILKVNGAGEFIWAKSIDAKKMVECIADEDGNVFISGYFQDTVDFDPGDEVYNVIGEAHNTYVLKLDENGDFIFVKSIGSTDFVGTNGLDLDNLGNLYLGVNYSADMDFDPGPDVFTSTATEPQICVLKLNELGEFEWAKAIGSDGEDYIADLKIDLYNQVHITGSYQHTVDFDPGDEEFFLTCLGYSDTYLLTLNSEGEYVKSYSFGGAELNFSKHTLVDAVGNIYLTGEHAGVTDFDPGEDVFELTSLVGPWRNLFVVKLNALGAGIVPEAETSLLSIYPNPTAGSIQIQCPFNTMGSVAVYGADGKYIAGEKRVDLSTYELVLPNQQGLFFIEISTAKGKEVFKVTRY